MRATSGDTKEAPFDPAKRGTVAMEYATKRLLRAIVKEIRALARVSYIFGMTAYPALDFFVCS